MLKPGDLIHIYCNYIKPEPKYKFAICISPQNPTPLFFFVNTEPRTRTPDAQLLVRRIELPALTHDSYIDTSKMVTFFKSEIDNAELITHISDSLKKRISDIVKTHSHLPALHEAIVHENLG